MGGQPHCRSLKRHLIRGRRWHLICPCIILYHKSRAMGGVNKGMTCMVCLVAHPASLVQVLVLADWHTSHTPRRKHCIRTATSVPLCLLCPARATEHGHHSSQPGLYRTETESSRPRHSQPITGPEMNGLLARSRGHRLPRDTVLYRTV